MFSIIVPLWPNCRRMQSFKNLAPGVNSYLRASAVLRVVISKASVYLIAMEGPPVNLFSRPLR